MSIPHVVDGETELDSALFNPIIDRTNGLAAGTVPIALAGIEGALGAYEPLANMRAGVVNVLDYGAVGNGDHDDTDAFEEAWAVAIANRGYLGVPAGNFTYDGPGLSGNTYPVLRGAGMRNTSIILGADSRLIDTDELLGSMHLSGFNTVGGKGLFRSTYTGANVQVHYTITDFWAYNYTGCAIEHNSSDMPYWNISNGVLWGANTDTTMGIALSGLADQSAIRDVSFVLNRVGLKMRNAGGNALADNCDFIRFIEDRDSGPCVDVWLVPHTSNVNAGATTEFRRSKFGNENLVAGDFRVLFADEESGATNGERFPDLSNASAGYVDGIKFSNTNWSMKTGAEPSFAYSMTPNVRRTEFGDFVVSGGPTEEIFVLEFDALAEPFNDRWINTNTAGPIRSKLSTVANPRLSNAYGAVRPFDPTYEMQAWDTPRQELGGAGSYSNLFTGTTHGSATVLSTSTKTATTDSLGGSDASILSLASGYGNGVYWDFSTLPTVGRPVWVELELAYDATGTPLTNIQVLVKGGTGDTTYEARYYAVPPNGKGWGSFWFPFPARDVDSYLQLVVNHYEGSERTVKVGRIRMYHANGRVLPVGAANADTSGATLGDLETEVNELKALLRTAGMMRS